jgi:hypothetical protein
LFVANLVPVESSSTRLIGCSGYHPRACAALGVTSPRTICRSCRLRCISHGSWTLRMASASSETQSSTLLNSVVYASCLKCFCRQNILFGSGSLIGLVSMGDHVGFRIDPPVTKCLSKQRAKGIWYTKQRRERPHKLGWEE